MLKLGPGDTVPVISLKNYFHGRRTLVVPPWQREYSWLTTDEGQVSVLLQDLAKFARDTKTKEYLLGSIILCDEATNPDHSQPLLIDGQQRTLTLSLFLMCCSKYLKTKNLINPDKTEHLALAGEILNCLNQTPYGSFSPRVSMTQSRANEILSELYAWSEIATSIGEDIFKRSDSQTFTQRNLAEVAKFIYDQISIGNWLTDEEIVPALIKILSGIKFIELTLTDKKESIQVFNRINDRGMQLSSADLIKNILFSEVSDKDFDLISDHWATMSGKLMETKKARLQDPKYLMRVMAMIEDAAHLSYDDLVDYWSKKFESEDSKVTAKSFAADLPKLATQLLEFVSRKHPTFGQISEIFFAAELGSVQHFAVLLAGADISNQKAFFTLMRQVNYRTMLYMFAKERTQTFDTMIPKWAFAVAELGPNATEAQLNAIYKEIAEPSPELFDALKDNMDKWLYTSTSDRKKIRATLAFLSAHLDFTCGKPMKLEDAMRTRKKPGDSHAWEIEHILPQALDDSEIFQTIGNLTFLCPEDNRDASDSVPQNKSLHYNQCNLILTKTVSKMQISPASERKFKEICDNLGLQNLDWNLDEWDSASIEYRADFYFKYISYIFKTAAV